MEGSDEKIFEAYAAPLIGQPVTRVWQGHGTTLFLEFGRLISEFRRDGTMTGEIGAFTLMIDWSWRIEKGAAIMFGSGSADEKWPAGFEMLRDTIVIRASLFGRSPEIDLELSNGLHVVSFSTIDGDPQWTLFNRDDASWITVKAGELVVERETGASADILH
jgi:hypothetical protein